MGTLEDETVVVTGASRGLGASVATRLATEGANVVLTARNERDLEEVAATADGETLVAPADVTDEAAVEDVVSAAREAYGPVTGLVNNAGIGQLSMYGELRPFHEVDAANVRRILEVNVVGVHLLSAAVVPGMFEVGRGNVINVSSALGKRASTGWGPYVASKWALEGVTATQAMELEGKVNVNAIDPGGRVETGFWEHLPAAERREILDPDVMDEAVTRLLAQGSDGVTGESLTAAEWERRLP